MSVITPDTIRVFGSIVPDLDKIIEGNHKMVEEFLSLARRGGPLDERTIEKVKQNCRANLFGLAFFALNSIFKTKKFHQAQWVFVSLPPNNHTKSSFFHETITGVIELVVEKTGTASPLRTWVNRNKAYFDTWDKIHLSKRGSERKERIFKEFLERLVQNCHTTNTFDYMNITNKFNAWLKGEDERQGEIKINEKSKPKRRTPLRGEEFKEFEKIYYPKNSETGKKLAILERVGKRHTVPFGFGKSNVIGCHWDSHGRDLLDGSRESETSQRIGDGYFYIGGKFSISPGCTFYDFDRNLDSETMKLRMGGSHDTLVAIINFGTNDLLDFWDAVTGLICQGNPSRIKTDYCQACQKNSKSKYATPWKHVPESKATKEFLKINQRHLFVKID